MSQYPHPGLAPQPNLVPTQRVVPPVTVESPTGEFLRMPVESPTLAALLREQFRAATERAALARAGETSGAASLVSAAEPLLAFCEEFLGRNPPVEIFPVSGGYGLLLANGLRCRIGGEPAGEPPRGLLPDAGAVRVTAVEPVVQPSERPYIL